MKDRLFIAIPAKIDNFQILQKEFNTIIEGKYSLEEQLHLTVVFLGDLFSEDEIVKKLQSVDFSFTVSSVKGIGYFDQSKVLVGLCENDSIEALRIRLCHALNMECNNHYHLHVTLMRVKKNLDPIQFQQVMNRFEKEIGSLEPRLILYRSHLTPNGARYIPLKEFVL